MIKDKKKLIVIGIDGFDRDLMFRFIKDLPNFSKIINEGHQINTRSTYPYDSETAWATIFTGLNPAETGVLNFKNPFANNEIKQHVEDFIYENLRGKTIWDHLSRAGKKVCILFPHAFYPAWEVNGVMVCRSMRSDLGYPVTYYPNNLDLDAKELSKLNTLRKIPTKRNLDKVIEESRRLIENELKFGLKMLKSDEWDFFFIYSSSIDYIQHFFWHYFDESDPLYPGNNPYKNVIKDFYILYDKFVAEFMRHLDGDTGLIVLSDHGHGMRPFKLLNVNEILRKNGLLKLNSKSLSGYSGENTRKYIVENLRELIKKVIIDYQLSDFARRFLKRLPTLKKVYIRSSIIDYDHSLAHVSDLSGIKSYSYGGVVINKKNVSSIKEYEKLRHRIINILNKLKDSNGNSYFNWICRREELYRGKYIDLFPDIVFELRDGYGVGWEICKPLITNSKTHLLQPGGHRVDTPIFLMYNLPKPTRSVATLMDIYSIILDILSVK